MEIFYWYKGYGIRYLQITGTTYVEDTYLLKSFVGMGELKGRKLAEKYINSLISK